MKTRIKRSQSVQEPTSGYNESSIVIYESDEGVRVDVKLAHETVWLTQKQMAELFNTERSVITKHLGNIFASPQPVAELSGSVLWLVPWAHHVTLMDKVADLDPYVVHDAGACQRLEPQYPEPPDRFTSPSQSSQGRFQFRNHAACASIGLVHQTLKVGYNT